MQSSIDKIALHLADYEAPVELCPALNDRVPGLATCSLLASDPHVTHQMRCEDTGALLGEWTDSDMTFREPVDEPHRDGAFSRAA